MATQNMKRIAVAYTPRARPDGSRMVRLGCGHVTTAMHYDPTVEQWITCMECDAATQEARFGIWNKEQQAYVGGQYEIGAR